MARVESSNFAMICCWWLEYSVVECWLGEVEIHIKGQNWSATNEDRAIIMMFPNSSRHFFDVSWLTLMPVSWQQQQQPRNDDWKVVAKREKTISGRVGEEKYANCAHDGCLRSLKLFHALFEVQAHGHSSLKPVHVTYKAHNHRPSSLSSSRTRPVCAKVKIQVQNTFKILQKLLLKILRHFMHFAVGDERKVEKHDRLTTNYFRSECKKESFSCTDATSET